MPIVNGRRLASRKGIKIEVKEIATLLKTKAIVNSNATLDRLKKRESPSPTIYHLATHGLYDKEEFTGTNADGLFGLSRQIYKDIDGEVL
jgi:CHAT domain-containing protein